MSFRDKVLPALAELKDVMKKRTKRIVAKLRHKSTGTSPPPFPPTKATVSPLPSSDPAIRVALSNFIRHLDETERRGPTRAAENGRQLADKAFKELQLIPGRHRHETAKAAFALRLLELSYAGDVTIFEDDEE
ncbi:hypothetical protein DL771_009277 [Monosporascus sp. 5C6A]|nr:hypothetical protein DL771_009277 [Monosporascus sp. 5C6A]